MDKQTKQMDKLSLFCLTVGSICVLILLYVGVCTLVINSKMPSKEDAPYTLKINYYQSTKIGSDPILLPEDRMLFKKGWITSTDNVTRLEATAYWVREGIEWVKYDEPFYMEYYGRPFPKIECIEVR